MPRGSAAQRGYDARWRKARAAYLRENPLCAPCGEVGRVAPAEVVHHKIPHRGEYRLFWDPDNWQSRCKPCHTDAIGPERTGRPERYRGAAPDGTPLDPAHHWNVAATGGGM